MNTIIKPIIKNNSHHTIFVKISVKNNNKDTDAGVNIINQTHRDMSLNCRLLNPIALYLPVGTGYDSHDLYIKPNTGLYCEIIKGVEQDIEVSVDNMYVYGRIADESEREDSIRSVEIFEINKPKLAEDVKIMETWPQMTLDQYLKASLKDPVEVKFAQEVLNCIGTQPNFISDVPIDTVKQILNDKDNMIYRWVCIDEDRWLSRQVCGCYNISDLKYIMGFLDPKYKMKNAVKHILFAPFEPFIQPDIIYSITMEDFLLATEPKTSELSLEYRLKPFTENSYQKAIENLEKKMQSARCGYLSGVVNAAIYLTAPYPDLLFKNISSFFQIDENEVIANENNRPEEIFNYIKDHKLGCKWWYINKVNPKSGIALDTIALKNLNVLFDHWPDDQTDYGYFIFTCMDCKIKNLHVIKGEQLRDLIQTEKTPEPIEPKSLKDILMTFGIDITNELEQKDKPQETEMTFSDLLEILELYFEDSHGRIVVGGGAENFLSMTASRSLSYKWAVCGSDVLGEKQCWAGTGKFEELVGMYRDINKNNNVKYILFSIASETIGSITTVGVLAVHEFLGVVIRINHGIPNTNAMLEKLQSRTKIREEVMPDGSVRRTSEKILFIEENMKVNVNVENNNGCFVVGIGRAKNLSDEQKDSIKKFARTMNKQNFNHNVSQVVFNFKTPVSETKEPCTTISIEPDANLHVFVKEHFDRWSENTLRLNDFLNDFFGPKTGLITGLTAQRALIESAREEEHCKWLIIDHFHNDLDIDGMLDPLMQASVKAFCTDMHDNEICLNKIMYIAFEKPSNDEVLHILTPDEFIECLDTFQAGIEGEYQRKSIATMLGYFENT